MGMVKLSFGLQIVWAKRVQFCPPWIISPLKLHNKCSSISLFSFEHHLTLKRCWRSFNVMPWLQRNWRIPIRKTDTLSHHNTFTFKTLHHEKEYYQSSKLLICGLSCRFPKNEHSHNYSCMLPTKHSFIQHTELSEKVIKFMLIWCGEL